MLKILTIFTLLSLNLSAPAEELSRKFRVTIFHGSHRSCRGGKLTPGYSCAADFRIIPYGTIIHLSYGNTRRTLKVEDKGPAVDSRRASRKTGNQPIIDIYWKSEKAGRQFLSSLHKSEIVEIKWKK